MLWSYVCNNIMSKNQRTYLHLKNFYCRDFPGGPVVNTSPSISGGVGLIWNSNTLATWCEELTHLKRPWCWERLRAGGEGEDRGWDGWMASLTQWTWVWVDSGSWWWTGRPGMLRFMGLWRVGHDWATELNWGAKTPHASWPKNQNITQKQYCNKFNKDFKKGPHQKLIKITFLLLKNTDHYLSPPWVILVTSKITDHRSLRQI